MPDDYNISWMEETGETPFDRIRRREAQRYAEYEYGLNQADGDDD